jgi:hypothetical protein
VLIDRCTAYFVRSIELERRIVEESRLIFSRTALRIRADFFGQRSGARTTTRRQLTER